MTEPPAVPAAAPAPPRRREAAGWPRVVGYFVVFFASLMLMGVLFTLGGVGIILAPGATPPWLAVGYILLSIAGSVLVSLLLANRIFRISAPAVAGQLAAAPKSRPSLLGWIAGISGTVLGGVLSAALSALALRYINR